MKKKIKFLVGLVLGGIFVWFWKLIQPESEKEEWEKFLDDLEMRR